MAGVGAYYLKIGAWIVIFDAGHRKVQLACCTAICQHRDVCGRRRYAFPSAGDSSILLPWRNTPGVVQPTAPFFSRRPCALQRNPEGRGAPVAALPRCVGPALTVATKTDYNTGLCCGAVIYASKQQDSSPAQRDGCPARKPAGPCISAAAAAATN